MKAATRNVLRDYGYTAFIAIAIALLIRLFLIEAYRIPGSTMRPTLEPGDTIFVQKWPYGIRIPGAEAPFIHGKPPTRGDVIVFSFPGDSGHDFIKRIIGLSGETIQIKKGLLSINGKPLPTELLKNSLCGSETLPEKQVHEFCTEPPALEDFGPEKIPDDSIFVLGDLRSEGIHEPKRPKTWGIIAKDSVIGRAFLIWLSIEPNLTGGTTDSFPRFRFSRIFKTL